MRPACECEAPRGQGFAAACSHKVTEAWPRIELGYRICRPQLYKKDRGLGCKLLVAAFNSVNGLGERQQTDWPSSSFGPVIIRKVHRLDSFIRIQPLRGWA